MAIVILGVHGDDAPALNAEDAGESFVNLAELLFDLIEDVIVGAGLLFFSRYEIRRSMDGARDVEDEFLASELSLLHHCPVTLEAFVAVTACPYVLRFLSFLVVA